VLEIARVVPLAGLVLMRPDSVSTNEVRIEEPLRRFRGGFAGEKVDVEWSAEGESMKKGDVSVAGVGRELE